MSITVGQRIKALREARGWSQEDLANRTGVTRDAVHWLEASAVFVALHHLAATAKALGVTADELLSGTQAPISEDPGEYAVDPAPVRLCIQCAHYRFDKKPRSDTDRYVCQHPDLMDLVTGGALPCNRHNGSLCGRDGAYFAPIMVAVAPEPPRQMMTAYFEHEALTALQAACNYVNAADLNPEWKTPITAHEASPGVAVVRHPNRQAVMAVIGRMGDTDHDTLVGVEWTELTAGGK